MKKSKEELRKELDNKVLFLERQINDAKNEPFESDLRIEFCYAIATTLRSIVCYNQNEPSLVARCGLRDNILFQLENNLTAMDELPSYPLIAYSIIKGKEIYALPLDSITNINRVSEVLISFKAWLQEIVIDPKIPKVFPLARYEVIKILADHNGAHVDSEDDERFIELSLIDSFPIRIQGESKDRRIQAITVLTETIISIASEFVFSYKYLIQNKLSALGTSKYDCYIQSFNEKSIKIITCMKGLVFNYQYNTNKCFQCITTKKNLSYYEIKFRDRKFCPVSIVII